MRKASGPPRAVRDRLRIPDISGSLSRPRLLDLLQHSTDHYGATLVSGRAGTGKTTLAADFAMRQKCTFWCSVEPADSEWQEFAAAFSGCLKLQSKTKDRGNISPTDAEISEFLGDRFAGLARRRKKNVSLIVLDNVHHLFDASWFTEFFRQLIVSLDKNVRLLMLCRSKPSAPLWRLRSKQMLNVIDENLLDLTSAEALAIGRSRGLPETSVANALSRSYGRVGTFIKELEDDTA